jgi:hypothetical protein
MSPFQEAKLAIIAFAGLPKDALHIYVGLAAFLGAAALFRRPLSGWLPLTAVILVALAGELWDVIDTRNVGRRVDWWRNWHDIWNTLFWPFVLFLLARYTRVLRR